VGREFKVVLLVALTNCTLLAVPPMSLKGNPQVIVSVYNDAQVPGDTLARAELEATNTFLRSGLDISWLNCTHSDTAACNELGGPQHLFLRITPKIAASLNDTAFGIAFIGSDETGRNANVFWRRVKDLQQNSKADMSLILGSVMAHEIGHLLLGSNSHALSGIMRARWESDELHRISMGSLLFLPEQGKRMRARLDQRKEFLVSSRQRPGD
jgi:hypothetical protein